MTYNDLGRWANMRFEFIKQHRPQLYQSLLKENKLHSYLVEFDRQVQDTLILTGTDAAGADITQMVHCSPQQAWEFSFSDTYDKLDKLPIPTIAVIEGYALGGGLELALACDMRIAAEDARMGLPEITLGIMPGAGGTVRLPALVGRNKAMEMICMGRPVKAHEALDMGLVNLVVPKQQLQEQVETWCRRIVSQSRVALEAAKRSVLQGQAYRQIQQGIAGEAEIWAGLFESYDQKEGMSAFLEKRKPAFQDR